MQLVLEKNRDRLKPSLCFALCVALSTIVPAAFYAADANAAEERQVVIEEVIVTATKREESAQDVPLAVTALSAETLDRAGVFDLRDLSTVAGSFNMNSSQTESQGTTLRIRGVGTTGNNIGLESAVGVFLDGVYLSRPGVALSDLADIESIEVLRGPQGTLFGRNTSAGALNVRTKGPNFEESEYFFNATAGNFGLTNFQAGASGPLADNVAYRLTGAVRNRNGYVRSEINDSESYTRDRWMLRGQLAFDPTDTLSFRVIADYSETDEECCDAAILSQGLAAATNGYARAGLRPDGGVLSFGDEGFNGRNSNAEGFFNDSEQWGLSIEANWDLSDSATLTYIASYRDFDAGSVQSDFVGLNLYAVSPEEANGTETFDRLKTFTQELRIAGETERVSWLVGAYYSDEEIREVQGLGLSSDLAAFIDAQVFFGLATANMLEGPAALLGGVPLATGGTFGDVLAATSPTAAFAGGANLDDAYARNIFDQEGTSWSVFTHNSFHLTPQLDLVVGLRWTDEKKDGSYAQPEGTNDACLNVLANSGALNAGAAGTGLEAVAGLYTSLVPAFACFPFASPADTGVPILPVTFDDTFEDDELVYTGKLVYAFTDDISAYVSYTHGFKAGGFNLDATAAIGGASPAFNSETIDSWEVGLKSDWFDRRLRVNVAAFDYDIEDFQVLEFTGVQFQTFNVPSAESRGLEIETTALLTPGLMATLNYTLADSRYPNGCAPASAPANVTSLCGADLTNAPLHVVTGSVNYDGYINDALRWFATSNFRWEDDRRTSTQPNLEFDIQEDNIKVNARVGIGSADERWTFEVWGNNIFDELTKNVTFNTPLRVGSRGTFLEQPATYGATLRMIF
ncbi:MAG: TonB-dependent receptor [Pseudomonadota bacterium]